MTSALDYSALSPERRNVLTIRTPEGIVFSLPLAGAARRFLAWGIDLAITILFGITASTLLSMTPFISPGIAVILFFVFNIGYSIVLEWFWRGRTLGKFVLGIRVMDAQGLRMQFSQVAIRNLLRFVDAMPILYLAGGVTLFLSRKSQRLGDIAANTVVVTEQSGLAPDYAQIRPDKYNSFHDHPHLEARLRQRVSPRETSLLVQALLRRDQLEAEARVTLYGELAAHLRELVSFPEEATFGLSEEQYLRNAIDSIFRNRRDTATS